MALADGIAGFFNFDGDLADFYELEADLEAVGTPEFDAGQIVDAVGFNLHFGSSNPSRLFAVDDDLWSFATGDKTITGWAFVTTYAGNPGIMGVWSNDGGDVSWLFWFDGTNLTWQIRDQSAADHPASTPTAPQSEWFFFAMRRNASTGAMRLRINDEADVTATAATVADGVQNFQIADRNTNLAPMVGAVDAVGVWDRELEDEELDLLYNGGAGVQAPLAAEEPVADFEGDPVTGAAPLSVEFTDLSTNGPTEWLWDFGDGDTSTDQNPIHEYQDPGTYTVELNVSNLEGVDDEVKVDYVTVGETPPGTEFVADVLTGGVPLEVHFTDLSTLDPFEWLWDFGDGTTSTEQNPTHTYYVEGDYTVSLTATNDGGPFEEEKIAYIDVAPIEFSWLLTRQGAVDRPIGQSFMIVEASSEVLARNIADAYFRGDGVWMNAQIEKLQEGVMTSWDGWSTEVTVGGGIGEDPTALVSAAGQPGDSFADFQGRVVTKLIAAGLTASYSGSTLTVAAGGDLVGHRSVRVRIYPPASESDVMTALLVASVVESGAESAALQVVYSVPTLIPVILRSY